MSPVVITPDISFLFTNILPIFIVNNIWKFLFIVLHTLRF